MKKHKKSFLYLIAPIGDGAFLMFTAYLAVTAWWNTGFDSSIPYWTLHALWCISSTLAKIAFRIGAMK